MKLFIKRILFRMTALLPAQMLMSLVASLLPYSYMRNKQFFNIWRDHGYFVIPNHFYEPIPDVRLFGDEVWHKQSEMVGVDLNAEYQLSFLRTISENFQSEYQQFPKYPTEIPYEYCQTNNNFKPVDAAVLYSMIRHVHPRRIIEIGSGYSTYVSAKAVLKNCAETGMLADLVAIEPYPNPVLQQGFPGLSQLLPQKLEDLPLSFFEQLQENDIIFIDSSHVLKMQSDVQYEVLDILPRLKPGVCVHIHDIFWPMEYPKTWLVDKHRFWTEQYLIQAFMTFNSNFEVLWASHYMTTCHPIEFRSAFGEYADFNREDNAGSSLWLRRRK